MQCSGFLPNVENRKMALGTRLLIRSIDFYGALSDFAHLGMQTESNKLQHTLNPFSI